MNATRKCDFHTIINRNGSKSGVRASWHILLWLNRLYVSVSTWNEPNRQRKRASWERRDTLCVRRIRIYRNLSQNHKKCRSSASKTNRRWNPAVAALSRREWIPYVCTQSILTLTSWSAAWPRSHPQLALILEIKRCDHCGRRFWTNKLDQTNEPTISPNYNDDIYYSSAAAARANEPFIAILVSAEQVDVK